MLRIDQKTQKKCGAGRAKIVCLKVHCLEKEVTDVNGLWVDLIETPLPQCIKCKHLDRRTLQCPAFGNKPIPDDIQLNLSDHRDPYPGTTAYCLKKDVLQSFLMNIRCL